MNADGSHPGLKVYVAGHTGLLGSALVRRLAAAGYTEVLTRSHRELDLKDRAAVDGFLSAERPDVVILAAARVGGILANSRYPAEFIETNLAIQTSVIDAAYRSGVRRLIFFGSNCAYPAETPQPIWEEQLLTGLLEPSSASYAVAKIAGMQMCAAYNAQYGTSYLSVIPATLYGPGDNFDPETSHVLAALLRKFHDATAGDGGPPVIWGAGDQRREFLYVDDLADACVFLAEQDDTTIDTLCAGTGHVVNAGCGQDVSIRELAGLIADVVGYTGDPVFDASRPEGMSRRLLDSSRLASLGWRPRVSLREGVMRTYAWMTESAGRCPEPVEGMAVDGLR